MVRFLSDGAVALVTASIIAVGGGELAIAESATNDSNPKVVKEGQFRRVTVLGVERGVAFLESGGAVGDSGRKHGPHPVGWIRAKVLVEYLSDPENKGVYSADLLTPEGNEFAEHLASIPSATGKLHISHHASSYVELDLNPAARSQLFPFAVPEVEDKEKAKLLIIGSSGKLHTGDEVHLKMSYTPKNAKTGDEFLFVLPLK